MKRYDFMRLLVFFDLPVKTKKDKRNSSLFRKFLITKGFFMLQYSIYCKILFNREQGFHIKENIKKNVPERGNVRIMMITEKQFAKMEVIIGGISNQEETVTEEALIIL